MIPYYIKYYAANKEKYKAAHLRYRRAHPERVKACAEATRKKYRLKYRDRVNAANRQWRLNHPLYFKTYNKIRKAKLLNLYYLKHYKISLDEYEKLFTKQMGCCAICGTHQSVLLKRLAVDHNHSDGKVRGLLCHGCNTSLFIVEDKQRLENAIAYLEKNRLCNFQV